MVSISTKIGMLTMFSTMALGRELTGDGPVRFPISEGDDLVKAINVLADELFSRKDKQIVEDEFYINEHDITVHDDGHPQELICFDGFEDETLDFLANVTTDDKPDRG